MKKILFVINTMGQAGAEKSMIQLMKAMDRTKYELHLMVLINRGEMYGQVPPEVIVHNQKPDHRPVLGAEPFLAMTIIKAFFTRFNFLHAIPYILKHYLKGRTTGQVKPDKLLWKLVSDGAPRLQQQFDVAIAYLEGGAAYYVADHVKAEKKAAFIHIDYKHAGYTPGLDHGCYSSMDRIFLVSREAKKSFLKIYPELSGKIRLFHNIINPDEIKKLSFEGTGFQDHYRGVRILTIGRLHYQKAYDLAVPVLAKLREEGYEVRWYVLGEGTRRGEIEKLIDQYKVKEDFILLGAKSNPFPYLRQCDIYVQISRFEGKSIAIEEAQVLGKAIVASDCSGNREQIRNGENGIIVPLEQEAIINGIKLLLEDQKLLLLYEQASNRKSFDDRYNLELLDTFIEGDTNEGYVDHHTGL